MRWFKRKTKWMLGLLVLSLLLGSTGVAWAQGPAPTGQHRPRQPVLRGQVTAIDGATLTVETARGAVTVLTNDETRFRFPGTKEASLADIQIGQQIAVRGQREENTLHARLILVVPEGAAMLRGTVGAIAEQVLTVVTAAGEVAVQTDENTRFFVPGVEEAGLNDLELEAQVAVAGFKDEDDNFIARAVKAVLKQARGMVRGEVTAVQADGFTLDTQRGELSVQVDDQTRFRLPGVEDPGLTCPGGQCQGNDLSVGDKVVVGGARNEYGSLLARIVGIIPERPQRGWLVGQVTAVEGDTLTLTLPSGEEKSLLTDENTQFLVPGLNEATIADLNVGDTIGAQGQQPANEDEMPYAAVVAVLRDSEGRQVALWGELTAINGTTLTVKTKSGEEVQLLTDENTQFLIPGVGEASLDDLSVGDTVGAQVVEQEDGTLYASAVGSERGRSRPRQGAVRGEISASEGNTLILTTPKGEVTVLTDENTRFYLPGVEDASTDDLEIGQKIGAVGRWNEDGSLQARLVGTRTRRSNSPVSAPQLP
jgi:hypothetical protein